MARASPRLAPNLPRQRCRKPLTPKLLEKPLPFPFPILHTSQAKSKTPPCAHARASLTRTLLALPSSDAAVSLLCDYRVSTLSGTLRCAFGSSDLGFNSNAISEVPETGPLIFASSRPVSSQVCVDCAISRQPLLLSDPWPTRRAPTARSGVVDLAVKPAEPERCFFLMSPNAHVLSEFIADMLLAWHRYDAMSVLGDATTVNGSASRVHLPDEMVQETLSRYSHSRTTPMGCKPVLA